MKIGGRRSFLDAKNILDATAGLRIAKNNPYMRKTAFGDE